MQITIILVQPARPKNVGAVARAMKTMGFHQLRIVGSDAHRQPAASVMAHGACDILDNCQTYTTLEQALADMDFTIASTARQRGQYRHYHSVAQLIPILEEKRYWLKRIALVFGREASGLTNQELRQADLLSRIPMQTDYPSLNLGQAAMVYCYQLAPLLLAQQLSSSTAPTITPSAQPLQVLRQRIANLLMRLQVSDDHKLVQWLAQRIGMLEQRDIAMLHRLVGDIERNLPD